MQTMVASVQLSLHCLPPPSLHFTIPHVTGGGYSGKQDNVRRAPSTVSGPQWTGASPSWRLRFCLFSQKQGEGLDLPPAIHDHLKGDGAEGQCPGKLGAQGKVVSKDSFLLEPGAPGEVITVLKEKPWQSSFKFSLFPIGPLPIQLLSLPPQPCQALSNPCWTLGVCEHPASGFCHGVSGTLFSWA
jgi:hypothetical protein